MKGLILQKGAFNPLHRMHIKIAEDAISRYPDYVHTMLLSRHSCEKGTISDRDLHIRELAIVEAGFNVMIEDSGLFVDTIDRVRKHGGPDVIIVFPCGEDTLQRFFRDWEEHYDWRTNKDHWRKYMDYKEKFKNVTWLVSDRKTECRKYNHLVSGYLLEHNNVEYSNLDLDDISSTKIREGLMEEVE